MIGKEIIEYNKERTISAHVHRIRSRRTRNIFRTKLFFSKFRKNTKNTENEERNGIKL